jgi:hypothetical protein
MVIAYRCCVPWGRLQLRRKNIAATKGKRGVKKASRLKKGKVLRPVKPLKETTTFTFGSSRVEYTQQAKTGGLDPVVPNK